MATALHSKLLTDISDMMEIGSQEYNNFEFHMTQFVPRGILKSKANLLEKFGAMKNKGKLDIGKYESLKKVARDSGNNDILELIEEREPKILEEKARAQPTFHINVHSGQSSSRSASILQSTQYRPEGVSKQPNTGTACMNLQTGKKRKLSEVSDQSDPLYGKDERGRGKYDTNGKRGFLLILNFERTGLEKDVSNLQVFFGQKLGFKVKTISGVLTEQDIWRNLEVAREEINNDTSRQYYAFVCVIISHGNEEGILVKDHSKVNNVTISSDKIWKYFCNSADMNVFAGRPKLFFISSCRGGKSQDLHTVDEDDIETEAVVDESDEIFNVPTDADTLVAFANTQGYTSFGDSSDNTTQYTCFINALLDVFKCYYTTDHVEDMLISVREKLALGKEYYHVGACKLTKQMPCTWSTLTKRLYLTANQT